MGINVIITGATGMVGEGVLLECLDNAAVASVLVINRKPGGRMHAKLREIVHNNFFDLTPIEAQLAGYDACFFCLGTTSIGKSEDEYKRTTYDLTLNFAQTLAKLSPDLTFCYVSGASTDSTEQGKVMWARVKGATENAIMRLFKNSYMIRPGFMKATPGQRNLLSWYRYLAWMYPVGRAFFSGSFCTLKEVGEAMIVAATKGAPKKILEVRDMTALAAGKPV